jgi:uncharacterized protein (DUF362 family)
MDARNMVSRKYAYLTISLVGFMAGQLLACSGSKSSGASGGQPQSGSQSASAGMGGGDSSSGSGSGGSTSSSSSSKADGGSSSSGGATSNGGDGGKGGASAVGGAGGKSSSTSANGGGGEKSTSSGQGGSTSTEKFVVAMVQSSKEKAADLTQADVTDLVKDAVEKAGGLNFIKEGNTVVLKPNLVSSYSDMFKTKPLNPAANAVCTDWRIVKAVADLVRAKNKAGQILVMEGSTDSTTTAYSNLGYTKDNFGSSVDEIIALEGASCTDTSTTGLEQKEMSGKKFWVNSRFLHADVVISLPTMKTHLIAGITGGVKNLGIGMTPVSQYPTGTNGPNDCTRGQTAAVIDHSGPEPLGQFIHDYYLLRPADFVVMDALEGIEHGPSPCWDNAEYETSKKNMRMILAGKNAVAVDTVEALVMKCDPKKVPHLTKLEADGIGTTDISRITVVGKQISEVAKPFIGKLTDICPGQ